MKMNRAATLLLLCFVGSIGALQAQGQSVDCAAPTNVIPDGRLNSSTIPSLGVFWFAISTSQPLASYAVEADFPQGASSMPALAVLTGPCPGSAVPTRDIGALTPAAPNGQRLSFSKTTGGTVTFLIQVSNPGGASEALTLRVTETTMFSSAWSTFGQFNTFYSFVNTINGSIDLTLKLFDTAGVEVGSANLAVPAGQTLSTNTGTLGTTRNKNGSALLVHNGPAGGLLVEAAIANFAVPPGVVQPVKFQELRAAGPAGGGGGGGDITAVNTMMMGGLEGGATAGDVNLSLLTSCLNGQVLKWTGTMWSCQDDSVGDGGGGDITEVNTPVPGGLEGGSVSGAANLSLNTKCATGDVLIWDGAAWVCTATPPTDAQGNVGIGTSPDPTTPLTVEDTGMVATDSSGLVVNNLTNNIGTDGLVKRGVRVRSMGSFPGGVGTFTTNTGLDVQVDGADINQAATFMGGNVGIGTTDPDPSFSLEVVGDVKINSKFDLGTDACSSLSLSGRGRLCFNGTEFLVSEDGGAYQELLSAKDTVSGSTSDQILYVIQTGTGVVNPDFNNLPPSAFRGDATTNTNTAVGVLGFASGPDSVGVLGANSSLTGQTTGVSAEVRSPDGTALNANNDATTGFTRGVSARVHSPSGIAGRFHNEAGGNVIEGTSNNMQVFLVDGSGTVTATAFVGDGSGLTNLPGGGGGVSSITAGNGLTATPSNPITTTGTLDVAFAGPGAANTVARSDHTHALPGSENTGVGQSALAVNSGSNNTAVGESALSGNTNGSRNTALGRRALAANTASFNTAVGASALGNNTTGGNNTAVGDNALLANTIASSNTAVGSAALFNNTASSNTAVGVNALISSTGAGNIAIGSGAGSLATTGSNNIYIGNQGVAAESSTMRLGTVGTHTSTFISGIFGASCVSCQTVVVGSDGTLGSMVSTQRAKEDIRDMGEASERVLQLRPVVFRYRKAAPDGSKPLQYGLIAEEVAEVIPELVVYDAAGQPQSVQYHVLPALLLNELQRQDAKLQQQQGELAELRARLEKQDAELAELRAALRTMRAQR